MTHVSFILFPEFQMLSYVLATETLRVANKCAHMDVFSWDTRTATGAPVLASNGALMAPDTLLWSNRPEADLVLLCAAYNPLAYVTSRVRAYLARMRRTHCVIGGVDTGAIILAELGLLNGRKVVLHHEAESTFRERWPEITVSDQIFCIDQQRLTAAGGTATGDALLAWIARDVDTQLAEATSVGMVHGGPRDSETPQRHANTADPVLMQMHQFMMENLLSPISVTELCRRLALSPKQLRRRCLNAYGSTPSEYFRNLRLDNAHHLLVNSQMPVAEVAELCGFASVSSFSRAMREAFGHSPKSLRKRPKHHRVLAMRG